MRLWMCDECKALHGAAIDECAVCGAGRFVRMDVNADIDEAFVDG